MKKNSLFKFLKKDIVIFMTGLALVSYPVISNCIESKSQTGQIATYKEKTTDTAAEDKRCMIEEAEKWNMELYMNQKGIPASREFKYEDILDIGNGMIGSIEIPCINVNMPIYHGTSDSVLSTGAGAIYRTVLFQRVVKIPMQLLQDIEDCRQAGCLRVWMSLRRVICFI